MTDKQQIEQLKEALLRYVAVYGKTHLQADGLYTTAELMSKFGIVALPENAVVLTREKYDDLLIAKDFDYGYHKGTKTMEAFYENIRLPEVRKEVAKEILQEIAHLEVGNCLVAWDVIIKITDKILEIAKQYGVEVNNE